mmetsp:Transcript_50059/g.119091  ORF Transcript_50059/g.119091 Transcript_50059/m.119091 type:complete len:247 (-) Transcript_50059:118-858(-)
MARLLDNCFKQCLQTSLRFMCRDRPLVLTLPPQDLAHLAEVVGIAQELSVQRLLRPRRNHLPQLRPNLLVSQTAARGFEELSQSLKQFQRPFAEAAAIGAASSPFRCSLLQQRVCVLRALEHPSSDVADALRSAKRNRSLRYVASHRNEAEHLPGDSAPRIVAGEEREQGQAVTEIQPASEGAANDGYHGSLDDGCDRLPQERNLRSQAVRGCCGRRGCENDAVHLCVQGTLTSTQLLPLGVAVGR